VDTRGAPQRIGAGHVGDESGDVRIERGRPARLRPERRAHRRRSQVRCHRMTVSGWTRTSADRHRRQAVANRTQNIRSRVRR
jgi:hypothetical protein